MEEKIQQIPVLRSVYGGLTKSERRIADYIANHIGVVMEQTVADLAAQTESSEITISRFCKKLGCSGLKELKLMLAAGMSQRRPKLFTISMPVTAAVTSPLRSLPIFPKGCRIR